MVYIKVQIPVALVYDTPLGLKTGGIQPQLNYLRFFRYRLKMMWQTIRGQTWDAGLHNKNYKRYRCLIIQDYTHRIPSKYKFNKQHFLLLNGVL